MNTFCKSEKCSITEFDCEDSTCIDASLKCDGVDNCKYRYDEDKTNTCAESKSLCKQLEIPN